MNSQDVEPSTYEATPSRQEIVDEKDNSSTSQRNLSSVLDDAHNMQETEEDRAVDTSSNPPPGKGRPFARFARFWHNRLIEAGLIVSMGLYYVTGNSNLGTSRFFHLNPLYSVPFLLIFAILCWYRLAFAVALLPLALPFYLLPKTVVGTLSFSSAEIALVVCLVVAGLQLLFRQKQWQYWLSWRELRNRLGPFAIPILVFLAAAAISVVIAYDGHTALRAFRKEVFGPLLYLLLILYCLRSRADLLRLLGALLATGLIVALISIAQYFFFRHSLVLEAGNVLRVHAAYGSANSIGLLFDYILPIALTMVVARLPQAVGALSSWQFRLLAVALCLPLLLVLYLSQSYGAWFANAAALLFIVACSIRNRKALLMSVLACVAVAGLGFAIFHTRILHFLLEGHVNAQGIGTVTKRLYLWQTALRMIHDSPWLGYGMDNWLCHYSNNLICHAHLFHYIIKNDPVTGVPTGLQDEPTLSHPHNVFLHVWVSMGIFGLLAFVALLVLFFWLFARVLTHLRSPGCESDLHLQWMTIGVGAAMVAAMVQGLVDSSFLEQDLAFCFWLLVAALLLLRIFSGTTWWRRARQDRDKTAAG